MKKLGTDTFKDSISYSGNPGYLAGAGDVDALLGNLSSNQGASGNYTRNFYWYGHGLPSWIGCTGCDPAINICANDVANALLNTSGGGCAGPKRYHPYRFVFLDACYTGDDIIWAQAFGIPKKLTYAQLSGHPEKAQAFLGWKGKVTSLGNEQGCQWYQNTLNFFFGLWQYGFPLTNCVQACSQLGSPGAPYDPYHLMDIKIPLGAPQDYLSPGGRKLGSAKAIYGYLWITRTGIQEPH